MAFEPFVFFVPDRCINRGAVGLQFLEVVFRRVAAVGERLLRTPVEMPLELFDQRRHQAAVRTDVGRVPTDDQPRLVGGGQWHVVRRSRPAVGPLPAPRVGIGRRAAGLRAVPLLAAFPLGLQLRQLGEGLCHTLPPFCHRASLRRLDATIRRARILIDPVLQRLDLSLRVAPMLLPPSLPPERRSAGRGPHPHPVLSHPIQRHQPLIHQHRQHPHPQRFQPLGASRPPPFTLEGADNR